MQNAIANATADLVVSLSNHAADTGACQPSFDELRTGLE
jgi:hypothetical protein